MRTRFALVGVGQHAKWSIIPALKAAEHCELVAACDLKQENLEAIQDPSVIRYTEYAAMLDAGGFDVVYVATLEDLHKEMVIRAFEAGYHVLCEKPLGMNAGECEAMLAAAESAGKHLAVGFEKRYHPDQIKMRQWIGSGRLGRVEAVHIQEMWDMHKTFTDLSPRRAAHLDRSGSLDCGIHSLDSIRYITGGGDWHNIVARGRWFGELERRQMPHISIMADLDNGVLATLTESYAYCANITPRKSCMTYTVVGTQGVINWARDGDNELALSLVTEGHIETLAYEHMGHDRAIARLANDFSRTLQGVCDWPASLATGADGLVAQRIVDEALKQTHLQS
ncbi:MAG: hypothetical protein GC164_03340 [Phycisphaera sp.]|nr:hypothetical protein [Phycisphaera sp.]